MLFVFLTMGLISLIRDLGFNDEFAFVVSSNISLKTQRIDQEQFWNVYCVVLCANNHENFLYCSSFVKVIIISEFASLQCHNGHTLCSTCKTRVQNRCPTCRQELGDIRCLALEKVAESLELPCRYISLGCPEIFPYYSKLKHEALCNFRPYNCPYAGSECSVTGDIPFLVTHLRDDHKVDMHTGCTFNHRYVKSNPREVENATWMLTVSSLLL